MAVLFLTDGVSSETGSCAILIISRTLSSEIIISLAIPPASARGLFLQNLRETRITC
jgi:hypothetical protein